MPSILVSRGFIGNVRVETYFMAPTQPMSTLGTFNKANCLATSTRLTNVNSLLNWSTLR